ncbi:MAG: 8-oxo-dGTP diphosphatase [Clostridia bacterium]|nr:8-oxo-dGTP diphosphatase [Clostridia bacterium]
MKQTTLCYIQRGSAFLMLHRTKKERDDNRDKWIGIGGHIEPGETPMDCILRECAEETGLTLLDCRYRGLVRFRNDAYPDEDMHLFTATRFSGDMIECDEGELAWIDKDRWFSLTLWEGDRIFLRLLDERDSFFELTLIYHGEALVRALLDGKEIHRSQEGGL